MLRVQNDNCHKFHILVTGRVQMIFSGRFHIFLKNYINAYDKIQDVDSRASYDLLYQKYGKK